MRFIYDLDRKDWLEWVQAQNLPRFRADQILAWIDRGVDSVESMTDLPAALRQKLAAGFDVSGLVLEQRLDSKLDETRKYVFRLADGNRIESVRMLYRHGQSACISSQAGCPMGCVFCASAKAGFGRNLSAGEMLAQVARIGRDSGQRVSHVTVMGIGEPMLNLEALLSFLSRVNDPQGLGISLRHVSVSTCGLVPEMLKFTDKGLPVTLSVSLHAPNDAIRSRLMPIARTHDYGSLLAACHRHVRKTSRRISFEYALFDRVNDQKEHALELARRLRGMLCHVNLIAANEVAGSDLSPSPREKVNAFAQVLQQQGINVTVRRELGRDIMAACGQLRRTKEACGNS